MWQVSEGGGRCQGAAGGRLGGARGVASFPESVQKCCHRGPGLPGPTQRGQRHLAGGVGPGDHGFRLHSGQSSPGTPEPPGNRAGTHPAGTGARQCLPTLTAPRSTPLLSLGVPSAGCVPAPTLSSLPTAHAHLLRHSCSPIPSTCPSRLGVCVSSSVSPDTGEFEDTDHREDPSHAGPQFAHRGAVGRQNLWPVLGCRLSYTLNVTLRLAWTPLRPLQGHPWLWIAIYSCVKS